MLNGKRGQIAIFVIIAIVIVVAIVLVVVFRGDIFPQVGESEFSAVYEGFDSCVEQKTRDALSIAGSQGGYIDVPDFEAGSEYSPFSSQLDFFNSPVPYWYYVSGNNVVKEQVPSVSEIEEQIAEYLEDEIRTCDFSNFRLGGLAINSNVPRVDVEIEDKEVVVEVDMDLVVEKLELKETKSNHKVKVDSKFGKFYDIARRVYAKEKQEMFLENYAIDVMYNYAPVTGVEFTCKPMTWNPQEVVDDIREGLSANIGVLRANGGDYELIDDTREYFSVDVNSEGEDIGFMYMSDWPTRVEIWPVENGLMYAEPVGLEQGMGILGFCYVPYHFVYDIYFPVLIQVYDDEELFQFPVSVVIDKSVAREALEATAEEPQDIDEFCNYKNTKVDVYTFDSELNPVEADVSFTCLNQKCNIGKTEISGGDAVLSEAFPQCINGKILARAEGYVDAEYYVSTNNPTSANILMNKLYELDLRVYIGNSEADDELVLVNFESEENSFSVLYPDQKTVSLSEGNYNISLQAFGSSSLTIPASSTRQCVESASPGILGIFGKTEENCFDVEIPSQKIENGLVAGGSVEEYILESELKGKSRISLSVSALPKPASLEQLQQNYELAETRILRLEFT